MRDRGENNGLEASGDPTTYMERLPHQTTTVMGSPVYGAGLDSHPIARQAFLAANVPVMGNTGSYPGGGENSLVFISTLPSGMNLQSGAVVGLIPKIAEPAFYAGISLLDKGIRRISCGYLTIMNLIPYSNNWYMKKTAYSYGNDVGKDFIAHQPKIAPLIRDTGGIIQLLIPKEKIEGIYESKPFGEKYAHRSTQERLEWMQGHTKNDTISPQSVDMQVRIPLYPSVFENADSGIMMNMVVFAEEKKFRQLLTRMAQVVEELHNSKD